MKKEKILQRLIIGCSLAVALMFTMAGTAQAQEKGSAKGGASLLLKPVKTTQDIEALQPGDAVVMSCAKCKTITVNYVETTKGHIKEEKVKQEHLCPGCGTKIETKGVGKSAKDVVTHVCKKCGSEDVMCCVLKKGSGPMK
jgi:predicted RNA-binding Zn-ribbon protein involved in translation (DUF1610 family)